MWRQRSFWRRFLFFLLFRGADSWKRTVGHLCFLSFLAFQRCWRLGAHRRAPLFSFFSLLSAVLATGVTPPGTSAFLLFLRFSGADSWGRTAGHLCFTLFPTFQRCPPRHYDSVSIFSCGTISAELRMSGFLEKKETRSAELSEDEVRKKKKPDCTAIDAFSFLTLSSFLHEVSIFLLQKKSLHSPPRKFVPAKRRC